MHLIFFDNHKYKNQLVYIIITPSPLGLALIFGVVVGETVQDEDLAPLSAFVEGRQELIDVLRIQVQKVAVGVRLADLRQGSNCISHNLCGNQISGNSCEWGSMHLGQLDQNDLTMGLESAIRSLRESRKPWSSTIWALISCSLATHTAAVFLT